MKICSICGTEYLGFGHNAQPINDGRCCDACNSFFVIQARIKRLANAINRQHPHEERPTNE